MKTWRRLMTGPLSGKWFSTRTQPTKQAQEVIFSRKIKKPLYTPLQQYKCQTNCLWKKHLCLILDSQLSFDKHLKTIFKKVNKTIRLFWKIRNSLPRPSLMTLYKSFIRPHLDYGDISYDKPFNNSFQNKIESIEYNVWVAITGTIRGTSKERLYEEIGLESLLYRCCYRKLCYLYKIVVKKFPNYIFKFYSLYRQP